MIELNNNELHIWMSRDFERQGIILDGLTYQDVFSALKTRRGVVHTTIPEFCDTKYLAMDYRIFVHMLDGETVEIVLGCKNKNTSRDVKMGHDIHKLLMANEFGLATK